MKWDGYRAVLQVSSDGTVRLWSRNSTDLSRAFPDLIAAAQTQVAPGVVLDGEAVAWVDDRLSFDHLQHRMVASDSAARRLAGEHPASYVAFDILAADGTDVRALPRPHAWPRADPANSPPCASLAARPKATATAGRRGPPSRPACIVRRIGRWEPSWTRDARPRALRGLLSRFGRYSLRGVAG